MANFRAEFEKTKYRENKQQGFLTNLLQRTFTKFFNRHGLIVVKYGATLREMRFAIQAWIAPSYPYITYLFIT